MEWKVSWERNGEKKAASFADRNDMLNFMKRRWRDSKELPKNFWVRKIREPIEITSNRKRRN
jgi:hypothetical protein